MYAKIKNNLVVQQDYSWNDFVLDNNNTNFGGNYDLLALFPQTDLAKDGYECVAVQPTAPPSVDIRTQTYVPGAPQRSGDVWVQTWTVVNRTSEEIQQQDTIASQNVRADRNQRLAACDWTQLPDAPVDKTAWATYRQALRDVTSQANFPWGVDWPTAP
jgi:hypothetical protein